VAASGVGNLHIIEGITKKHIYVNIPPENMKASAENLGIQEHFFFYHDNGQNILHIWCLYNCPNVIKTPPQLS
jgi:hypothetical protein